jgi:hypothetical protein
LWYLAVYRLATLKHPEWDLVMAPQTANPSLILDKITLNMAQVRDLAELNYGKQNVSDPFSETYQKIGSIKNIFDSKFALASIAADIPGFDEATTNALLAFWDAGWNDIIAGAWNYASESYHIQ